MYRFSVITKTQIQVPEALIQELRVFAKQREWSLADTCRRGAELLLQVYPESPPGPPAAAWTPPSSARAGWKGMSAEDLREAVFAEADPVLPGTCDL